MKEYEPFRGNTGDLMVFHDPGSKLTPGKMIGVIVFIFLIAILGAAFTSPLQDQVTNWQDNLTAAGQATSATVVGLIPLLFWVLLAVGIILLVVEAFVPGGVRGL